jgi:hypothetical protein
MGHVKAHCPKLRNKKGSLKDQTCGYCGKQGHETKNCFEDPENAHRQLAWYKPKALAEMSNVALATGKRKGGNVGEITNAAFETLTGGFEFIFSSLTFPDDPRILLDANIFIANSAASFDIRMGHKDGMM